MPARPLPNSIAAAAPPVSARAPPTPGRPIRPRTLRANARNPVHEHERSPTPRRPREQHDQRNKSIDGRKNLVPNSVLIHPHYVANPAGFDAIPAIMPTIAPPIVPHGPPVPMPIDPSPKSSRPRPDTGRHFQTERSQVAVLIRVFLLLGHAAASGYTAGDFGDFLHKVLCRPSIACPKSAVLSIASLFFPSPCTRTRGPG